jgi:Zn-dependent metalloprotease
VVAALPYAPGDAASGALRVSTLAQRADGTTGNEDADRALRTAAVVDGVLLQRFGRDGVNGKGGAIELVVHAPDRYNAYWDNANQRIELGDGDGKEWGSFGGSVSVVAHEIYHGVIDTEVKLDYSDAEQGALHESFADVFAAGVVGSWQIGEDVITPGTPGDSIRDLAKPSVDNMTNAMRAGGSPHALSGVASLAAVRTADKVGSDAMQRIWYRALVDDLVDGANFVQAAKATAAAAARMFGTGSKEHDAVVTAWESVGVAPLAT